jgi:hypothetical protein
VCAQLPWRGFQGQSSSPQDDVAPRSSQSHGRPTSSGFMNRGIPAGKEGWIAFEDVAPRTAQSHVLPTSSGFKNSGIRAGKEGRMAFEDVAPRSSSRTVWPRAQASQIGESALERGAGRHLKMLRRGPNGKSAPGTDVLWSMAANRSCCALSAAFRSSGRTWTAVRRCSRARTTARGTRMLRLSWSPLDAVGAALLLGV